MRTSSLFIIALCTVLSLSLAAAPPTTGCVLDATGKQVCTVSVALDVSVRDAGNGPCKRHDEMCWCEKVKDYTNEIRRKNGVKKMLKLGPKKQMDNARRYAAKLAKMGRLVHQALPKVTKEVGCKRWVGGENLAYNNNKGDIARACVNQWLNSPGHFQNLIRDWFAETVTGFAFDKYGTVFCVQTFSMYYPQGTFGSVNGPRCGPVSVR